MDLIEIEEKKKYHKDTDTVGTHKVKRMKKKYDYIKYKFTQDCVDSITVDSKSYNYGMSINKIFKYVDSELEQYNKGQRTVSIKKHGYDSKFASHLFRLYFEGLRLLERGDLQFPMPKDEVEFMLDIKKGKYSIDFLLNKSAKMKPILKEYYDKNEANLPFSPDQTGIHKLQISILSEYWKDVGMI